MPPLALAPAFGGSCCRGESFADPQAGRASVISTASTTTALEEALLAFLDLNDFTVVLDFGFRQPVGDLGSEGAAGGDAVVGLGLGGRAGPGIDAVEQGELPLPHRAQLPDRFRRLAWLQLPEVEGLAVGGRAASRIRRSVQPGVRLGQDPDRPFRLGEFWLRVADREREGRVDALLARDGEGDAEAGDRALAGV